MMCIYIYIYTHICRQQADVAGPQPDELPRARAAGREINNNDNNNNDNNSSNDNNDNDNNYNTNNHNEHTNDTIYNSVLHQSIVTLGYRIECYAMV